MKRYITVAIWRPITLTGRSEESKHILDGSDRNINLRLTSLTDDKQETEGGFTFQTWEGGEITW
jgi:hypothetical protein